jgi:hypothetical protein
MPEDWPYDEARRLFHEAEALDPENIEVSYSFSIESTKSECIDIHHTANS